MQTDLAGKVVVVTGAAGGIGSAIARSFAAEGAHLVLHYRRNRRGAEKLRRELSGTGAIAVPADLTREGEVRRLIAAAVKRFGGVDTLVANAGSWETRDVMLPSMSLKQWRQTLDGVLTSAFLLGSAGSAHHRPDFGRGWRHGRALAVASRRSGSSHRVSPSSREFMRPIPR